MNTTGPANTIHAQRLSELKSAANAEERRKIIARVRLEDSKFHAAWLADDFAAWWATRNEKQAA
ncbi:MAG TPA: hypothetical protein VFH49_08680 [Aquabacterium sp.]|nr:hypothetical protein [Aquabacterium sp.]